MASEKVQTLTDGTSNRQSAPARSCSLISGRNGAAPAAGSAPTVDELAGDYDGKMVVGKLNVDENPNVAGRFSIRGIPTLLLFKGGQVVEQVVGLADKADAEEGHRQARRLAPVPVTVSSRRLYSVAKS